MKYILILFLLVLNVYPQEKEVTIIVTTPYLPDTSVVFISGSNEEFGGWNPSSTPLNKIDKDTWSRTFKFKESEFLEFKFTLGAWEHEALDDKKVIPDNHIVKIINDTVLNYTINYWSRSNKRQVTGQITGKVEYIRNFMGEGIKPRDIIIWLPPDYDKSDKRYPVLYAHDGQNIFDPSTSSFGIDWQMDEAADSLIRKKEIEPIIIVGLSSTESRFAEYSTTDSGYAYMKFIVEDLKPLIDRRYRTLPDRNNTAVIGSSMGGLISFMILWEYPDVFSKGACLSPAFQVRNLDYVTQVKKDSGEIKNIKVYIDNGEIGIESEIQPGIDNMIHELKEQGYVEGKDFYWSLHKEAEHSEKAWAKRFPAILKFLFGKETAGR